MPNITLNVPAAAVPRIKAAFGWDNKTDAEAVAFLKTHLIEVIRLRVRHHEEGVEAEAAKQTVTDVSVS